MTGSEERSGARPAPWQGPLVRDRVAVVTGGGGSIGAATCRALADHGADVVVTDIEGDRAAVVADEVRARGGNALAITLDLTEPGAAVRLRDEAYAAFGRVDILVNGLGHHLGFAGRFEESSEDQWDALYQINLLHVLRTCHAFLPEMRRRKWGRIINFSSVEGIRSAPALAVYTAFKGAIDSFTRSLAVDAAVDGVAVNAIAVDKTRSYQVNFYQQPEEYDRFIPVWVPAGHLADPEEVASVALFLASDLASWVIGRTIAADGGTLAAGGWYRTPNRWTNSPLPVQYFEDDATTAARPPNLR